MTELRKALEKLKETHQFIDVDYLIETISEQKEGEWITPYSDQFKVFDELMRYNLVATRIIPWWSDGRFRGQKLSFLYKHNLHFGNI